MTLTTVEEGSIKRKRPIAHRRYPTSTVRRYQLVTGVVVAMVNGYLLYVMTMNEYPDRELIN